MKKIVSILFHPLLLLALALGMIGVLIWWIGPLVAIGRHRPLDSEYARWVAIGVLVLCVVLRGVWLIARAVWRNRVLASGIAGRGAAEAPRTHEADAPGAAEVAELARRFERAIAALREARVNAAGGRPGWRDWLALSGRQYLYRLPWYVLIGASGSGKTTVLEYSGLSFPLADKFATPASGQPASPGGGWHANRIGGVGGTRHCDWWFTDRAVMIDTAGRYTTQESDLAADSAAWHGFLSLLRKTRPREPINGVLLAVSVAELLDGNDAARAQAAAALRARIHELSEHLGTRFPVYVMVTKADLLPGFTEFFSDLDSEARAQVFGFTLPADDAGAPRVLSDEAFRAHVHDALDALETRLVARVLTRTDQESNVAARAAVIDFPQQFAAFRPLLEAFLGDVFVHSASRDAPFMRGVYITSGTQRGAPVDRVLASLKEALRLERAAPRASRAAARSFFIRRMLAEVVFAEQGLACGSLRWMRRRHLARFAAQAAIVLAAALAVSLWSVSYLRNRAYVAAVDQAARALAAKASALGGGAPFTDAAHLAQAAPLLSAARALASVPPVDAADAPLSMQWGLWQGAKLGDAAQQTYRRLLDTWLLPYLSARMEAQLRDAARGTPAQAYDALKAYVSLYEPQHQDSEAMRNAIVADWNRALPAQTGDSDRRALAAHLDALFARGTIRSNRPYDEALVAATRARLLREPLDRQVYERMKHANVGSDCASFTIARAGGPNAPLVLQRASGAPLTEGVPGLYTWECYYGTFLGALAAHAKSVHDEAPWVLGPGAASATATLVDGVRRLYAQDYIREWEGYLADIRLIAPQGLAQSAESVRILSAPDSPLLALTREAARETALSVRPAAAPSLPARANKTLDDVGNTVRQWAAGDAPAAAPAAAALPEKSVDDRFARLRALVEAPAPGQSPPIVAAAALLGDVYVYLSALDSAMQQKVSPPASDVLTRLRALAAQLPEPLRTVLTQLGQSGAQRAQEARRTNASTDLKGLTAWCQQAIRGRYPFDPAARAEVPPQDFGTLFAAAPNGRLDAFFQKSLAAEVDMGAHPWAYKKVDGAVPATNAAGLADFERAATIRAVFFGAGAPTPSLTLTFKPVEMDASILQFTLDVDGQIVSYAHGPQLAVPVQWPAANGASRVSVQVTPAPTSNAGPLSYDGAWALFRMLDRVKIEPTAQPERFFATFDIEGRHMRFEVTAGSVQNPFGLAELRAFKCPEVL
ncbi:type VI secretion protein [Caballeronia megalochromosomata]|nr:type VI secretion protein [Caballeronia megalochromosomata]